MIVTAACLGGLWLLIYGGAYDVGADAPHYELVSWLLGIIRQRSIAVRSADIALPADLGDPQRLAQGAALYGEMCSGCHLAPGMEPSEISQGLYPRAPDFRQGTGLRPQQAFWVIKHGVKMSGMAAWGVTHSDELIWDMVAFLGKLPSFSATDYRAAIGNAAEEHEHAMHSTGRSAPGESRQ
ncbi:c-type cytochrome [Enhydrobacter aerosaccus]|uniref:c-type cytochrome n=1 Tax=Enhydrobacter aerosaccus TaxID=225324 RepID=UPI001C472863|nr:cytochrome c [Enhydrobacter aerosaccus]